MKEFKCPECHEYSTSAEWNRVTSDFYNDGEIAEIEGCGHREQFDHRGCDFICPICESEVVYEDIVDATDNVVVKKDKYTELERLAEIGRATEIAYSKGAFMIYDVNLNREGYIDSYNYDHTIDDLLEWVKKVTP